VRGSDEGVACRSGLILPSMASPSGTFPINREDTEGDFYNFTHWDSIDGGNPGRG
jgi:hypothetical protein